MRKDFSYMDKVTSNMYVFSEKERTGKNTGLVAWKAMTWNLFCIAQKKTDIKQATYSTSTKLSVKQATYSTSTKLSVKQATYSTSTKLSTVLAKYEISITAILKDSF